jgi:uncharacterized membrane protein YidH (DUF202 family)
MELRLRYYEWQRRIRKLFTHPVTGFVALIALVVVTFVTLVTSESRLIRSPHTPLVFSPK